VQIAVEEIQPIQKIGDGAFSEVYKAICKGTVVAAKKWRNLSPSEKEVQDLLREIEIGGFVGFLVLALLFTGSARGLCS
jgi:hypothetical protein